MGKVRLTAALAAIAATLATAAPAMADDPPSDTTVVGPGQVITDPASETEPTPPPEDVAEVEDTSGTVTEELDPGPTPPKRGEIHVLGTGKTASSPPAPAAASSAPQAAPRATAAGTGRSGAKTLPFTGVNAGLLALCGAVLLGSGLLVRRAVRPLQAADPAAR